MANQQERAVVDLVINGQQAKTSLKEVSLEATRARSALNKMREADDPKLFAQKAEEYQKLAAAQRQMQTQINGTSSAWSKFKSNMASTAMGVVGGNLLTATLSAIPAGISKAISSYREFNAASQELSAVTGATGQDLAFLNQQASKLGPDMGKSGAEMLEAFKLMASAKPELLEQKELLVETTKAAITLSQAGKIDLAEATRVTAESLNQFGESADQANRFINVIAAGAKEGSAEINEMGMALKASGTVAASQNVSFEQTNAVLQSMSTIALKGEQAGTMFRNVLLTLGSGAKDTNPKIVGLEQALDNLAKKNLSTAEMTKLFGKENIIAAQHVIEHRNEIAELTSKVTGTQEAFSQAAKNNQTLDHQLEIFWARVSGLAVLIGTKLVPVLTTLVDGATSLAKLLTGQLTPASQAATEAFESQRAKVADLTKTLNPLLDRHDQLKKKTILTKDEQLELKKIVGQVASIVPSAATEFDKYGNALAINTDKAREFVRIQKELLKYTNQKAIAETDDELASKRKELSISVTKRKIGTTLDRDPATMGYRMRQLSDDELRKLDEANARLTAEIADLEARRKGLSGDYLDVPAAPAAKAKSKAESSTTDSGESKEEKKARLKREREAKAAQQHEDSLQSLKDQARQRIADRDQDEFEKEQIAFGEHYAKMYRMAQGNKTEMEEITGLMYDELEGIQKRHDEKERAEKAQALKNEREIALQQLETERDIQRAGIRANFDRGGLSEDAARMAELQAEAQFLVAKKLLYQKYFQDVQALGITDKDKNKALSKEKADSEADIQNSLTKNVEAQIDARLAYAVDADEKERQLAAQRKAAMMDIFQESLAMMQINWTEQLKSLKDFWQQATVVQKAAFIASKAYSVAEATLAYSRTLMSIWANSGSPWAAVGFTALATATYGNVLSKIASTNYSAPAFADGGFTGSSDVHRGVEGPGGWVEFPTLFQMGRRQFVAGEAGREFVISNKALQNPVVADFARMMDVAQKTGNYGMIGGGSAPMAGGASPAMGALPAGPSPDSMLVVAAINTLHEKIDALGKRPIVNNYRLTEQYANDVQQIRQENTL